MQPTDSNQNDRSPAAGMVAGIIAGLAAAWAMNAVQRIFPVKPPGNSNPSTVNAANAVSRKLRGTNLPKRHRPAWGNVVHYAFGAALGGIYGMASEIWPRLTAAAGIPFGTAVAAIADEAMVPALGLGLPPWRSPARLHAYSAASHAVFGAVTEAIRNAIRPIR